MQFHFLLCLLAAVVLTLSAAGAPVAVSGAPHESFQSHGVYGQAGGPGSPGGRLIAYASERMQQVTEGLFEAGRGFSEVPSFISELFARAQDPDNLVRWGKMTGKALLVLALSFLVGWLVRRMMRRLRSSMEDRETAAVPLRILLMSGRILVWDAIPLAAFAVAAYVVLPLTDPLPGTRVIVLGLVNAGVLTGIVLVFARLVIAGDAPGLRMLSVQDESARYLYSWIRRLAGFGVFAYFILETAQLLGMPGGLYLFFMKLLGAVITLMLIILILQNKNEVAAWLREEREMPEEPEKEEHQGAEGEKRGRVFTVAGSVRRRIAHVWHIAAILFVLGIFATWAFEIDGGMRFLFTGLVATVVIAALAALIGRSVHRAADRLFSVSEPVKTAYPGLETRISLYRPVVRNFLKGVVYILAAMAILEAWRLGTLGWLFSPLGGVIAGELAALLLIIAGIFLVWEIINIFIERSMARQTREERALMRKQTLLPLLRNVVRITLVVIGAMLVLSQLGINIGPLLAGAGVIGLAVGFGAQTLVRDVITGAFILMEDALSVGDWVEAGGYSGTVEKLTVRTVTLRDLAGTVHVVPFGDVSTVTNYNRDYGYALIDAGVAYRERYGDVVRALQDVADALKQDETWGPCITGDLEVFGLNKLADSAVEIRVRLKTLPMRQFAVRRVFLEHMKRLFDERGIEIPFPHRTIWFGTDKDGAAPPLYLADKGKKKPLESADSGEKAADEADAGVAIASEAEASEDILQESEQNDSEDRNSR